MPYLLHNGLLLVKALLRARLRDAARRSTELPGHLAALSLGGELLDTLPLGVAHLPGPLGTLLLGSVTLGHVLTLLLLRRIKWDI